MTYIYKCEHEHPENCVSACLELGERYGSGYFFCNKNDICDYKEDKSPYGCDRNREAIECGHMLYKQEYDYTHCGSPSVLTQICTCPHETLCKDRFTIGGRPIQNGNNNGNNTSNASGNTSPVIPVKEESQNAINEIEL